MPKYDKNLEYHADTQTLIGERKKRINRYTNRRSNSCRSNYKKELMVLKILENVFNVDFLSVSRD
ncbi:hypothetical protein ACT7C1_26565 [Bacillus paranthracis]